MPSKGRGLGKRPSGCEKAKGAGRGLRRGGAPAEGRGLGTRPAGGEKAEGAGQQLAGKWRRGEGCGNAGAGQVLAGRQHAWGGAPRLYLGVSPVQA